MQVIFCIVFHFIGGFASGSFYIPYKKVMSWQWKSYWTLPKTPKKLLFFSISALLPGVQKFECLKQTSKKNKFDFGISMEFAGQKLYDEYSSHPDHVQFIQQYWLKYVEDFLEIDYEPLTK